MSSLSKEVDLALEQFGRLGPMSERSALAPLLTTAGAAPAARDERFAKGVSKFVDHIGSEADKRVQDLSLIWRLTSVSAMREHRRRLIEGLSRGVPPFEELPTEMPDPDDRRHFGDAMSALNGTWLPVYLSRAITQERDGEKAREALSRAFVTNVLNLDAQVQLLSDALVDVRFDQQDPSAGRSRRMAAILDALGEAVWSSEAEIVPGDSFGLAYNNLVENLARRPSNDRSASLLAARSLLRFLVLAVRLHGTLAADSGTYRFLGPLKRSLGTSNWPEELLPELNRAASQVFEQLLFLVRLKMPDADLRRIYLSMVGDGIGKIRLAQATEDPSRFEPDLAHWLRTGTYRKKLPTQTAIEETAVSAVDRDLGLALRETETIRATISAIASDAISAADFHSSRLGEDLKSVFDRTDRLIAHIESAARRRNLVLKGEPGEIVPFSPIEHEPVDNAIGARTVRIRSRAVERVIDGKSAGLVVKGDVEGA